MRCCGSWYLLAELAGTIDSLSQFIIAGFVVLIITTAWGDIVKIFHPEQRSAEEIQANFERSGQSSQATLRRTATQLRDAFDDD